MDFKTKFNELLSSGKIDFNSLAFPAPILYCFSQGSIPRSMLAVVTAAKAAKLSLNNINTSGFISSLHGNQDVAAIEAGYHSISIKQLKSMRSAGIDLDDLFSSITSTTEAA